MKCKDCSYYMGTASKEHGVCGYVVNYFPTDIEDDCHILKQIQTDEEIKCRDCYRLHNDIACMTCKPDDKACSLGYIDKYEEDFKKCLNFWAKHNMLSKEKIMKIYDEFEPERNKIINDITGSQSQG